MSSVSTKVILKVNDTGEVESIFALKVAFADPSSQVLSPGVLNSIVAWVFIKVIRAIKIKTTTFFIFKYNYFLSIIYIDF